MKSFKQFFSESYKELEEKVAWSHKSYDDYVAHNKAKGLQVIPKDLWHNLKKNPNQPSMKKEAAELDHEDLNSIAKDHDYASKKHRTAYAETRSIAGARNHEVAYNRHVDAAKAHREAANDKSKHSSEKLEKMSNHAWDATDHIRKYFDEEVELEEVKKPKPGHNASVMAKNISKVLSAVKKEEVEND
jgi:hypothetical protein